MRRSSARVLIALWLCRLSTSYAADNSLLRPPTEASQRVVLGIPLGAPRHQVEAIFTEAKIPELRRDTGMTVYKEPPAKIKNGGATILLFHEDKLAKVALLIDTESQTAEPYIFRYQELKESLSEKYGQPKTSTEYIDENYRTHPLLATKTEKGTYASYWKAPDLDIALILRGDNFTINFSLHYEYRPLFEKTSATTEKTRER